jgi:hypothetical protein
MHKYRIEEVNRLTAQWSRLQTQRWTERSSRTTLRARPKVKLLQSRTDNDFAEEDFHILIRCKWDTSADANNYAEFYSGEAAVETSS